MIIFATCAENSQAWLIPGSAEHTFGSGLLKDSCTPTLIKGISHQVRDVYILATCIRLPLVSVIYLLNRFYLVPTNCVILVAFK